MCGIAGSVGTQSRDLSEKMTKALRHRGPDGIGFYPGPHVHMGATRLKIIDLNAGSQPLYNETRSISIVFNGEIYNHFQLRTELRRKGHVFASETDTEVVVHLYEEMGKDCV